MNKVFHADFHTRRCLSIAGNIDFEVHIANGNNTQNFARRGGEVSANWLYSWQKIGNSCYVEKGRGVTKVWNFLFPLKYVLMAKSTNKKMHLILQLNCWMYNCTAIDDIYHEKGSFYSFACCLPERPSEAGSSPPCRFALYQSYYCLHLIWSAQKYMKYKNIYIKYRNKNIKYNNITI